MPRSIAPVAALALAGLCGPAFADPTANSHAAACVAALKARETGMAAALQPDDPVEPELLKVVRSGIAIIGTRYLAGLREAEARRLLEAAEHDFQLLPPATAQARQAQCLQEGDGLYRHASPLERGLITSAAQRRIKRLRGA